VCEAGWGSGGSEVGSRSQCCHDTEKEKKEGKYLLELD